jgi:plasmid stability protein
MGQILIRNIEDDMKARLKRQAARHGRSMEGEARDILRDGLKGEEQPEGEDEEQPEGGLGTAIAARFRGLGLKKGDIKELHGEMIKNPFEE